MCDQENGSASVTSTTTLHSNRTHDVLLCGWELMFSPTGLVDDDNHEILINDQFMVSLDQWYEEYYQCCNKQNLAAVLHLYEQSGFYNLYEVVGFMC